MTYDIIIFLIGSLQASDKGTKTQEVTKQKGQKSEGNRENVTEKKRY